MARSPGLGMDAAFDQLRCYSRDNNLRLSEVARQIADGRFDVATLSRAPSRGQR